MSDKFTLVDPDGLTSQVKVTFVSPGGVPVSHIRRQKKPLMSIMDIDAIPLDERCKVSIDTEDYIRTEVITPGRYGSWYVFRHESMSISDLIEIVEGWE